MEKEIKTYLKCAASRVIQESDITDDIPWNGSDGIFFLMDDDLTNLLNTAGEAVFKRKYKKTNILLQEINHILVHSAAKQVKEQKDQTGYAIHSIEELYNSNATCILPNFAITLDAGLEEFNIGPVQCLQSSSLKSNYPTQLERYNLVIDQHRSGLNWVTREIFFPDQCFVVKLISSPEQARTLAEWNIDIALSLLRLHFLKHGIHQSLFPMTGRADPFPFRQKKTTPRDIIHFSSGVRPILDDYNLPYSIFPGTAKLLIDNNFNMTCQEIFDPERETVGVRIQSALGWMSKARRANDLATRFLFFFTAYEAILNLRKGPDTTERMARNAATILYKGKDGHDLYRRFKKLYEIRSVVIHQGARDVGQAECYGLQELVELTCIRIIEKNCLNKKIVDFCNELERESFGINN